MLGWAIAAVYVIGFAAMIIACKRAPIRENYTDGTDDAYDSENFIDPEMRGGR